MLCKNLEIWSIISKGFQCRGQDLGQKEVEVTVMVVVQEMEFQGHQKETLKWDMAFCYCGLHPVIWGE